MGAQARRREAGDVEIGKTVGPWDEETPRNVRLPRWVWAKLAHIAKREADAGKKSKRTRQKVSSNDVLMSACEHLITTDELTNGRINLPAIPPPERAAKKKPAAKKGRGT